MWQLSRQWFTVAEVPLQLQSAHWYLEYIHADPLLAYCTVCWQITASVSGHPQWSSFYTCEGFHVGSGCSYLFPGWGYDELSKNTDQIGRRPDSAMSHLENDRKKIDREDWRLIPWYRFLVVGGVDWQDTFFSLVHLCLCLLQCCLAFLFQGWISTCVPICSIWINVCCTLKGISPELTARMQDSWLFNIQSVILPVPGIGYRISFSYHWVIPMCTDSDSGLCFDFMAPDFYAWLWWAHLCISVCIETLNREFVCVLRERAQQVVIITFADRVNTW